MLLLLGVIALFYFKIDPTEVDFLLICPLYSTSGIYCPGCGSQRAIHNLLHLDFLSALKNNFLLVIGLLLFVYHYGISMINNIFNKNYSSVLNHTMAVKLLIIGTLLFWILRNLPIYPFTLLAP